MAMTPVYVCKLWNAEEECYEDVRFVHVGFNTRNGINVLLVGLEDVSKLRVIMHPTWLVKQWMENGNHEELPHETVVSLMRECANIPPLAKKIWDDALI